MAACINMQEQVFYKIRQRLNALNDQRHKLGMKIKMNTRGMRRVLDEIPSGEICNSEKSLYTLEILENKYKKLKSERMGLLRTEAEILEEEAETLMSWNEFGKPDFVKRLRRFVKENEALCKEFGEIRIFEYSIYFLDTHPDLVCEEAARFLIEWGLKLEMDHQSKLAATVIHQSVCLQYILELGCKMETNPAECVMKFYRKILNYSLEYQAQFENDVDILVEVINRCAICKPKKNLKQKHFDKRKLLETFEVIDSLPSDIRICFVQQNIKLLQHILLNKKSDEALYHLKRCIDVGIWDPKGNIKQSNRNKAQQGNRQQHPVSKIQTHPVYESPDSSKKAKTNKTRAGAPVSSIQHEPVMLAPQSSRISPNISDTHNEDAASLLQTYQQYKRNRETEAPFSLKEQQQAVTLAPQIDCISPNVSDMEEEMSPTNLKSTVTNWCRSYENRTRLMSKQQEPVSMTVKRDRAAATMQVPQQEQKVSQVDKKKLSKCDKAIQTNPGVFIPCIMDSISYNLDYPYEVKERSQHNQNSNLNKSSQISANQAITKRNPKLESVLGNSDFTWELQMKKSSANRYVHRFEDVL